MKAIAIKQFGDLDQLKLMDLPIPQPLPNEVQIKVSYAGINPVDWKICFGLFKTRLPHEFPIILGWDVSGIISQVGAEVKNFRQGDEVFAYLRKPHIKDGSFAEFVCFDAQHVVKKPESLSFAQAAAIPLVALTAWQSLLEVAKLKSGETILIHAGAGGVGGIAIEIAHHNKAKVITTAHEKNHAYVKQLGADIAIDYTKQNFTKEVKKLYPKGVDVVLDCVGNDVYEASYQVIAPQGRLVSICVPPDEAKAKKFNIQSFYVFVRPEGKQLQQISQLFDNKTFISPEIQEFRLEEAKEALELLKEGHVRGKLVLKVS